MNDSNEPEFMTVSKSRFCVLLVSTAGIYQIYWFYKQWQAIKRTEQPDIWPFPRALFAIFFCYNLFTRINTATKKYDYTKTYSPKTIAITYIVTLVATNIWGRLPYTSFDLAIFIAVLAAPIFILWPVQRAVNFLNQNNGSTQLEHRKYSGWEIFFIIIGSIFVALSLIGLTFPDIGNPTEDATNSVQLEPTEPVAYLADFLG